MFKGTLQNLPLGLIIYDYQKKVHFINKTACEILSIESNENISAALVNRKFSTQKRPESKPNAFYDTDLYHRVFKTGGEEIVLYRKELPISIQEKEYVISAFIDITPIENERKFEAASNTAKSDFLAKMSHEIRTPMNGIFGMAEALEREKLSDSQKEYIQIMRKSADLLLNIINDILDYSKIEAGKMQIEDVPYRLREEVAMSVDVFRVVAEEKELLIEIKVSDDVPDKIIGDPFRLRQVLSNLISNSIKFTDQGKILVSVDLEEEYSGNLTLLFAVADTGVGIPKDRLASIFDSFTQAEKSTSRKYGGTGLGTTICKQLVTLMNGEIWAESPSDLSVNEKYPGSRFNFTIEVFSNEELVKDLDFSTIKSFSESKALIISSKAKANKRLFTFLNQLKINTENIQVDGNNFIDLESTLYLQDVNYETVFILDEQGLDGLKLAEKLNTDGLTQKARYFLISADHNPENYIKTRLMGIDYYLHEPFEQKVLVTYLEEIFPAIKSEDVGLMELSKNLEILVAEDNLINQKVAQSIFKHLGQHIDIANDGNEAIERVNSKSYDIIFMDLDMPNKNGFEAAEELRKKGYQIPIIAMTASVSESNKNQALKVGMNDYIIKPVKNETIQAILEKWFA